MHSLSPTSISRRLPRAAAALTVAACLGVPAAASADSIVYIDGGNVWSASPDGSKKVQLTDGGNWHSPTQADNGTIAAVEGTGPIQVMASDGRPIRTITTTEAPSGNGGTFAARPVQLSFSPDGSKIAYAYTGLSCPPASTCTGQTSVFYTRSDVTEATPQSEWGNEYSSQNPEWVTNERALVFSGAGSQVSIDDLSGGDYSRVPWVTPNTDMGDGEVSRDGKRLAVTFDYGDNLRIGFLSVNGDVRTQSPPPQPDAACDTVDADVKYADPTWSPDSTSVAYASSKGIEVLRFTKFGPNECGAEDNTVLTATGQSPDWGPGDPPVARYTPDAGGGQNGGGGGGGADGGGSGGGVVPGVPVLKVSVASKVTRAALRKGLKVKVTGTGAVRVKLALRGKRLAAGSLTGTGAVKSLRLSKVARRKAARLRGKRVVLTATAPGAAKVTRKLTVR